jgi:HPt (histidine-containing phosphotransfer) domain-containing protein
MPRLPADIAERPHVAEPADAPPLAPREQSAPAVIDLAHLACMTQGEEGLQREVLELFVLQADILLGRMRGETPMVVAALAHTLCGSARGVGARAVAEAAEALERSARSTGKVTEAVERLAAAVAEARAVITGILHTRS